LILSSRNFLPHVAKMSGTFLSTTQKSRLLFKQIRFINYTQSLIQPGDKIKTKQKQTKPQ